MWVCGVSWRALRSLQKPYANFVKMDVCTIDGMGSFSVLVLGVSIGQRYTSVTRGGSSQNVNK